jgi:hypothetical protein
VLLRFGPAVTRIRVFPKLLLLVRQAAEIPGRQFKTRVPVNPSPEPSLFLEFATPAPDRAFIKAEFVTKFLFAFGDGAVRSLVHAPEERLIAQMVIEYPGSNAELMRTPDAISILRSQSVDVRFRFSQPKDFVFAAAVAVVVHRRPFPLERFTSIMPCASAHFSAEDFFRGNSFNLSRTIGSAGNDTVRCPRRIGLMPLRAITRRA